MTSIFRSILVASGIFAAFAAVQPALHAQGFGGAFSSFFSQDDEDDDSPVDVSASSADIYLGKSITLLGNVKVVKNDIRLTCNKMEIFLKEKTEKSSEEEKEKTVKEPPKPAAAPAAKPSGEAKKESKKEEKEGDGFDQSISKLICTGEVVYRQQKPDKPEEGSMALGNKGVYDEKTGVIVMTGGHMNPEGELSKAMYEDIVRVVGKDMIKEYPIMKQGAEWVIGDKIEVFVKERNHMRIINVKARSNKAISSSNTKSGSNR